MADVVESNTADFTRDEASTPAQLSACQSAHRAEMRQLPAAVPSMTAMSWEIHTSSEVARILLDEPFVLYAANQPLEAYPLELVLEIRVPRVQEEEHGSTGPSILSFHPDDEVAKDSAAPVVFTLPSPDLSKWQG